MSDIGFVYILKNPAMPGLYKVGATSRSPHARALDLYRSSGVPEPYQVVCHVEVALPFRVEQGLHQWMHHFRASVHREFFDGGLEHAIRYLWWHPRRLNFCDGQGRFDDPFYVKHELPVEHLFQLPNPWAGDCLAEPSPSNEGDRAA